MKEAKVKHYSSLQHCSHRFFIRNKCIECGKPRSLSTTTTKKCGNNQTATLPLGYLQPNLTLTFKEIRRRRDDNLRCLLSRKKLHLLLDLDHTLVHSTLAYHNESKQDGLEPITAMDDTFQILNGTYTVKLRPGVREFLEQVSSMFDLSVYTLSQRNYANEVVKLLDNDNNCDDECSSRFSSVIAKEDCLKDKQKGLDIVLSHERVVLIADDSKKVWKESGSENLINVSPYYYFPDKEKTKEMDKELDRVLSILQEVHSAFYDNNFECGRKADYSKRDVRKVLQRVLSKQKMEKRRLNPLYSFFRKICIC